jgi:hypothetical protein
MRVVLRDPAEHLAVEQKRQATEHLLLGHVGGASAEADANPVGELLVICHRVVLPFRHRFVDDRPGSLGGHNLVGNSPE